MAFKRKCNVCHFIGLDYEYFIKDGMAWDNYGDWHLDHIIPICSANSELDAINLCHYKNFQPLWAIDNQIKSGKIL